MSTIKKLTSIITILLCIISLNLYFNITSVFAADDCELSVSSAQGNKGDEVTIKVTLESNTGLAGLQYSLQYDTSALSLVSANALESAFKEPVINSQKQGLVVYVFAEATSNTRTGDLMEIKFKVLEGANNNNLSLKLTDVMGVDNDVKKVNIKTTNGSIQVAGAEDGNQNNMTSNNDTAQNNDVTQGNTVINNNDNSNVSNDINNTQTDKDGNIISNDSNNENGVNNTDNTNDSKKTMNKGMILFIVIIVIAVLAGAGYFIYSKKYKKNKDDNNNGIM